MCGRGCSSNCSSRRFPSATCLLVVSMALLLAVTSVDCAALLTKRAVGGGSASGEMGIMKICHNNTPCGWAVYTPFARKVDYFVQNTCECSKDKRCLRGEDDLSVSAYVYRCSTESRPLSTNEELPVST